jgi:hypothetical protein
LESRGKVLLDLKERQVRGKDSLAQFRCCNREGEFEGIEGMSAGTRSELLLSLVIR